MLKQELEEIIKETIGKLELELQSDSPISESEKRFSKTITFIDYNDDKDIEVIGLIPIKDLEDFADYWEHKNTIYED